MTDPQAYPLHATDPTPWAATSLDVLTAPIVQHLWRVHFWGSTEIAAPAWDIEVTLGASRVPMGLARFKLPASYLTGTATDGTPNKTWLSPYRSPQVTVLAGWRNNIGANSGPAYRSDLDDRQTLFTGWITRRTYMRQPDGNDYVQFEASTGEVFYEYPSHRTYAGPSATWTQLSQVTQAFWDSSNPWYRSPAALSFDLNTPTAAQLASFRGRELQIGDTLGDYLRGLAAELGQWLRPAHRLGGSWPTLLVSRDYQTPPGDPLNIPAGLVASYERTESWDQWANIIDLTAAWTADNGDAKSKRRTFLGAGVAGYTPTADVPPPAINTRAVTVQAYPPSGSVPAGWAPGLAWINKAGPRSAVRHTATMRALWWLLPKVHSINLPHEIDNTTQPGQIDTIAFQVDAGTMTVTWTSAD